MSARRQNAVARNHLTPRSSERRPVVMLTFYSLRASFVARAVADLESR